VAPFTVGGALAVLTKTAPDEVSGHFDREPAWFMGLRATASAPTPEDYFVTQPPPGPAERQHHDTIQMDHSAFDNLDFKPWLSLHLPPSARVVDIVTPNGERFTRTGAVIHTAEHRAEAHFATDDPQLIHITQDSRRLFDTVEGAWRSWQHHGQPDRQRQRIGITARTNGTQHAWLDTSESPTNWPLPITK